MKYLLFLEAISSQCYNAKLIDFQNISLNGNTVNLEMIICFQQLNDFEFTINHYKNIFFKPEIEKLKTQGFLLPIPTTREDFLSTQSEEVIEIINDTTEGFKDYYLTEIEID